MMGQVIPSPNLNINDFAAFFAHWTPSAPGLYRFWARWRIQYGRHGSHLDISCPCNNSRRSSLIKTVFRCTVNTYEMKSLSILGDVTSTTWPPRQLYYHTDGCVLPRHVGLLFRIDIINEVSLNWLSEYGWIHNIYLTGVEVFIQSHQTFVRISITLGMLSDVVNNTA